MMTRPLKAPIVPGQKGSAEGSSLVQADNRVLRSMKIGSGSKAKVAFWGWESHPTIVF